jgi:phosphatidylglycerol---prolipoprotein diacylglyceryl transferase
MPSRAKRKKASQRSATGQAAARSQPSARGGPGQPARGVAAAQPDAGPGAATSEQTLPPGLARRRGQAQPPADDHGLAPGRLASRAPGGPGAAGGSATQVRPRTDTVAGQAPTGQAPDGASDDMPSWAVKALEEVLTCSCWLDPGEHGEPFSATIRFSGRRTPVAGKPQPADAFRQEETVTGIVPGSGPVAITAEVRGLSPGEWEVAARPAGRTPHRPLPLPGQDDGGAGKAPWPRRVAVRDIAAAPVRTARAPFAKVPGIVRFAYAGLIALGVLVGLGVEVLLLKHDHYAAGGPLLSSLAAVAAGVVGAKVWFITEQRGRKLDGWCIQAFIAGAAIVVVAAALAGVGAPPGAFIAAAATAVLLGMAIGRPGCFWAGCCAGRPTAARWGIWSSDRRLGCRRYPAQLLEALAALVIGLGVLSFVLLAGLARSGPIAVAGLAAYTLGRQFILPLRAEPPRRWRYGRQVTTAAAAVALVASVVVLGLH